MADVPASPPQSSKTTDDYTHHTSPVPAQAPQAPLVKVPVKNAAREITGKIRNFSLPDSYTKHPNAVGRPKNPRG
jgi:hypothetical protein